MNSCASWRLIPARVDRPKSLIPYASPKLTILAIDRSSAVTSSGGLRSTRAAVSRWMSASRSNASRRCSSPLTWARIRSSIWL